MKDGKVFIDTNILVYAYDISAGEKHIKAVEIMKDLWNTSRGIISTQVLQEFFVSVTRKIPKPLDVTVAKEIVKDILKWKTVIVDGELILQSFDIHKESEYSYWDSAIIAAATTGGAKILLSDDLSDKHVIKGVEIRNPFKEKTYK